MFVLAGCIFDFDYYFEKAEKQVNELKICFFGKNNLILRSYDIRKQKSDFACLVDRKRREEFYQALDNLVKRLEFKVISAAIEKNKLKNQYSAPDNPYHLCFQFILERAVMYLGASREKMMLKIESRETHNDQKLAKIYEKFKENNHRYITAAEVQRKLADLSFSQKMQNIAGMQIADLVAYPLGKWVLNSGAENKAFAIVQKKLHRRPNSKDFLNYGLKIFP